MHCAVLGMNVPRLASTQYLYLKISIKPVYKRLRKQGLKHTVRYRITRRLVVLHIPLSHYLERHSPLTHKMLIIVIVPEIVPLEKNVIAGCGYIWFVVIKCNITTPIGDSGQQRAINCP